MHHVGGGPWFAVKRVMRNRFALSTGLVVATAFTACDGGPGEIKEPPVLTVTSPARGTIQGHAGQITVTGTAVPNAKGDAVTGVTVNNVQATVAPDGSFSAVI